MKIKNPDTHPIAPDFLFRILDLSIYKLNHLQFYKLNRRFPMLPDEHKTLSG